MKGRVAMRGEKAKRSDGCELESVSTPSDWSAPAAQIKPGASVMNLLASMPYLTRNKAGSKQTLEYVKLVVHEVIEMETGADTCEVRDLRSVLRRCMHRKVSDNEHSALLGAVGAASIEVTQDQSDALCGSKVVSSSDLGQEGGASPVKLIGGAQDLLTVDVVAEGVFELSQQGKLGGARLLLRKDFLFSLHHGGQTRAQVFAMLGPWLPAFVCLNVLLLNCSSLLLGFAATEIATLSFFGGSPFVVVIASLLVVVSSLSLRGSFNLRHDLARDENGKETTSQRQVEVAFWLLVTLTVILFVLAVAIFANEPLEANLQETSSYFPGDTSPPPTSQATPTSLLQATPPLLLQATPPRLLQATPPRSQSALTHFCS